MRKRNVAALIGLLGMAGWFVVGSGALTSLADGIERRTSGECFVMVRAEPLCPLC